MKFSCILAFLIAIAFFYFIIKLFKFFARQVLDIDRPKFVYVPKEKQ